MSEMKLQTLSVLVENAAGVLSQVTRLFTRKGYNIESLAVGVTDSDNNLMVLELKARKAGVTAVRQLRRYLEDLENTDNHYLKEFQVEKKKIRGLLVAPSIMDDALELLEEEGIEFVSVEPPRELKRDKKVTLDFF